MPRILVATDGSDFAIAAARRALSLLAADSAVTVITVVPLTSPVTGITEAGVGAVPVVEPRTLAETQDARAASARADLDATVAALGIAADGRVEFGDPATTICQVAGSFDLVVIGSHGSGLIKRALLGSVSHYVLHHAPCPVLVVREVGIDVKPEDTNG